MRHEAGSAQNEDDLGRFELLAHAVAGRRVAVVGGAGERSFTDGEAIFLADLPPGTLPVTVTIQAALLAAGSLDGRVMMKLTGRRSARLRYLTLEAARATVTPGVLMPRAVEQRLRELYGGPLPTSAQESLNWAGDARHTVPEAPEWLGTIKPIRVLRANPLGAGAAPTEKDKAGEVPAEELLRELDDEEESERSRILELFSAPIRNPLADMLQKFFGMGRTPGEGGGGEELPVGGHSVGPVGANAQPGVAPPGLSLQLGATPIGHRYPEWDFRRRAYRHDHCSVAQFDPPPPQEHPAIVDPRDPALRRQVARLGLSQQRHRRQDEGDVLDLTALVDLFVDRAAGRAGDARVYENKRRTAHDLGVLVLLDTTGSTGESSDGERIFDEQRLLVAKITAALEELGDRVATFGFYSRGREAVRFLRVKEFDDRFDHGAQRRLAALTPGGYTRLGAAIRHATQLLCDKAGTSQLLLMVVGDGLPYEEGYEHRYAQEDSRHALLEAVARGVGCACVSVRSTTEDDVMLRVWGDVAHRRLEDASELQRHIRPLFGEALRVAGASRRTIGSDARAAA